MDQAQRTEGASLSLEQRESLLEERLLRGEISEVTFHELRQKFRTQALNPTKPATAASSLPPTPSPPPAPSLWLPVNLEKSSTTKESPPSVLRPRVLGWIDRKLFAATRRDGAIEFRQVGGPLRVRDTRFAKWLWILFTLVSFWRLQTLVAFRSGQVSDVGAALVEFLWIITMGLAAIVSFVEMRRLRTRALNEARTLNTDTFPVWMSIAGTDVETLKLRKGRATIRLARNVSVKRSIRILLEGPENLSKLVHDAEAASLNHEQSPTS